MKFLAASWRAAIAVDWNLTCIEGVPGLVDISGNLETFPRLVFGISGFHERLPVWTYNGEAF